MINTIWPCSNLFYSRARHTSTAVAGGLQALECSKIATEIQSIPNRRDINV